MVKDPVCLAEVDEQGAMEAGLTVEYNGQTQYFCCERCKREFEEDPASFSMRSSDFQHPDELDADLPRDYE